MTPPVKRDQLNTTASAKDRRETERLAALEYLRAVRPGVDHILQELVDEVRGAYGTDLCMVNLNLSDVQYFSAWSGELDPDLASARQGALEHSMCQYVVNSERPLVVEDFLATEEFREQHWHVNYGIRFYAGTPLITSAGHTIGTLCLLNIRSVEFGEEQMKMLGAFARAVVGRLELLGALEREQSAKEEEAQRSQELQQTLDSLSAHIAVLDGSGEIIAVNGMWEAFAAANGGEPGRVSEGANYLHVCESATDSNAEEAATFAEGIRDVLAGRRAIAGLRGAIHDLRHEKERPFVEVVESLVELNRQAVPERGTELVIEEGFPRELPGEVGWSWRGSYKRPSQTSVATPEQGKSWWSCGWRAKRSWPE